MRGSECRGAGLAAQGKHQEQHWVFLMGKYPTALPWNRPFSGAQLWGAVNTQLWGAVNSLCLEDSSAEPPGSTAADFTEFSLPAQVHSVPGLVQDLPGD